jgi:hypothetical protein
LSNFVIKHLKTPEVATCWNMAKDRYLRRKIIKQGVSIHGNVRSGRKRRRRMRERKRKKTTV